MTDTRGLHHKYTVTRTDGTDQPGGKHDGCFYFVLDLTHDEAARSILPALADAYEKYGRLSLARDLRNSDPDMPLASPGIATASRSLVTPPDHPAGINHPDDQWTTTIAELAKFADAGGDLGEWESLDADGLHELWWPIRTDELDNLDGRFPLRVRRRQP